MPQRAESRAWIECNYAVLETGNMRAIIYDKSGLNMAMCGLVWWTTDIGGFYGGEIETDYL